MRRLITILLAASTLMGAATPMDALLQSVKEGKAQSDTQNRLREEKFLKEVHNQASMLEAVKRELAAENRTMESLKKTIDEKEKVIAKLQETLHIRSSNLGEMFGVVRQVSGDQIAVAKSSLVFAQYPDADAILLKLGKAKELPNVDDLRALWFSLQVSWRMA